MAQYDYNLTSFPNQKCSMDALTQEIIASTITIALDYINQDVSTVSIFFKSSLPTPDVSTLDYVVANHNINLPLAPEPVALPLNLEYQGIGSDITFGTPRTTAIPDFSKIFAATQIQVLGTKGPNLSNIIDFAITWDSITKNLNTLYLDTNNGIPAWYVNLLPNSSHNLYSPSPWLSLKDTSIANLDGTYWANVIDNSSFVLASQTGNFTLLFRNSSTGYIPIQYNTNFALLDASNQLYNSNIPAHLCGTQFNYVQNELETTTTSTTFQTKLTLNVSNLQIGTYRISVSYTGNGSSTSYNFESRIMVGGVQLGGTHIQRITNVANYTPVARTFFKTLSGNTTIQLQWRSNNTLGTARIKDAVIELWRVN